MFAFSRKRLSERQLEQSQPKQTTVTAVEVIATPVATSIVPKTDKQVGVKAKKMGSLLMKAKQDGSLESRVENMEAALDDNTTEQTVQ